MRTKTPTMNVSLTDALREVVDERLRSGLYGNASEYVRELIRRDEEAARQLRAPPKVSSRAGSERSPLAQDRCLTGQGGELPMVRVAVGRWKG